MANRRRTHNSSRGGVAAAALLVIAVTLWGGCGRTGPTIAPVAASLQGLYVRTAPENQLALVDLPASTLTTVGPALAKDGLRQDTWTPSALDTTGKWMYAFAHNTSSSPMGVDGSEWILVATFLGDGSVRSTEKLVIPSLKGTPNATQLSVDGTGGWDAYVCGAFSLAGRETLVVVQFNYTFPWIRAGHVIAEFDVAQWALGAAPPVASSLFVSPTQTIWYALERGLAGFDPQHPLTAPHRHVLLPASFAAFLPAGYDPRNAMVWGLASLTNGSYALAHFADTGQEATNLTLHALAGSCAVFADGAPPVSLGSAAALLWDQSLFAVLRTDGSLQLVGIPSPVPGEPTPRSYSTPSLCPPDHGYSCISTMAYEPFVF